MLMGLRLSRAGVGWKSKGVTKEEELWGLKEEGRRVKGKRGRVKAGKKGRVKRGGNRVGIRGWVKFGKGGGLTITNPFVSQCKETYNVQI
jgi:hypothetical protein